MKGTKDYGVLRLRNGSKYMHGAHRAIKVQETGRRTKTKNKEKGKMARRRRAKTKKTKGKGKKARQGKNRWKMPAAGGQRWKMQKKHDFTFLQFSLPGITNVLSKHS